MIAMLVLVIRLVTSDAIRLRQVLRVTGKGWTLEGRECLFLPLPYCSLLEAHLLNQSIAASFTCLDGGAVASCDRTTPNASNFDIGSVDPKSFMVSATDNVGNASQQFVSYIVGYGISVLFDQAKAAKSGSVIPIKLQLC